ncbi:MAG TPA: molybdenum cofactor biosynthesis protein MoaE [Chthoniobacteraceae bacterium]|nr:molybdenum cofactor biosynthesis protein MoaE [Chthoniobacteraceae bacterium]
MQFDIRFTHAAIVVPALQLPSTEIGACIEFQGIVRATEKGAVLAGLHYEAYEPMALRELQKIIDALGVRHPCRSLLFIHRLGWVPVGEASLFVRVLAAHREEALAFCGELITCMKQDVPIWKRVQ